jgi:hypothetical protein
MRPVLFACLLGATACDSPTTRLGGILAILRFGATPAQCARVYATAEDNQHQAQSNAIPRMSGDLEVGIAQSPDLGQNITVEAHGYGNAMCTGPWDDDSNVVPATFPVGAVDRGHVLLLLDGRPMNGGDGGTGEICNNGIDDNQDGLTDCEDPTCANQSCGAGGLYCIGTMCKLPGMEVNCADGRDDDLNGLTDCADPACQDKTCAGNGDACKTFTCGGGTCNSAPVMCTTPGECEQPGSGMCQAGSCSYTPLNGGSCAGGAGTCMNGTCTVGIPFTPSSGLPQTVPPAQAGGMLTINCATTFDTDQLRFMNLCSGQTAPPSWMVGSVAVLGMRGLTVTPNGSLTVQGSHALALLVFGDADIAGSITADAAFDAPGPGAAPLSGCTVGRGGTGAMNTGSAGGGAGHSWKGGLGGDGPQSSATGGAAGDVESDATLQPLRGGCPGGVGQAPGSMTGAAGGAGGGALQLTVAGTLNITGALSAAGGGGRAGLTHGGGGGGGGSGGGILLEATTVTLNMGARILTNGGGGGGGADQTSLGMDGENGGATEVSIAAGGQAGGDNGGRGGDGATFGSNATDGDPGQSDGSSGKDGGGGGGGGSTGRIVIAHGSCTQGNNVATAPSLPGTMCTQL